MALADGAMNDDPTTVARARSILNDLIQQRQSMRESDADVGLLEANRLGIVYWQWQLARAGSVARNDSGATAA